MTPGVGVLPEIATGSGYPSNADAEVHAVDGARVHLRPIRPADATALIDFHAHLDSLTVYRRFLGFHPVLPEREAEHFCCVDYQSRFALVAEVDGQLVGVARYDLTEETDSAEVAFVVADTCQGQGLGTLLLEHLALAARQRGISTFTAQTLASNAPMLEVFRRTGFDYTSHVSQGVCDVRFDIAPTQRYLDAVTQRDWGTARTTQVSRPGGVALIASSGALREVMWAHFDRLKVAVTTSVVIGMGPAADAVEALAMVTGAGSPVALALSGRLTRPRTFVARARAAARLLPISAWGLTDSQAAQSAVTAAGSPDELARLSRESIAARGHAPVIGNLSDRSGFQAQRAHQVLLDCAGLDAGPLPEEDTRELLDCYGVSDKLAGLGDQVVVVVTDVGGLGLGIELRSLSGVPLGGRRLLPLTGIDTSRLADAAAALGADASLAFDLIDRLGRLVDDQPEIRRVEIGLATGATIWHGAARANDDDPFLRRLP